jgi:hypothetical protein
VRKHGKSPPSAEFAAIGEHIGLACGYRLVRAAIAGDLRSRRAAHRMTAQASRSTMNDDRDASGRVAGQGAKDKRQDRLKLALRENLKRRKSQARKRADFTPASPSSDEVVRDRDKEGPGK